MKAIPSRLTHLSSRGEAKMVDVGDKKITSRIAVAESIVHMLPSTANLLANGKTPKGDVIATARIAGIQAAKRTPEWIPLCHHIALTSVVVEIEVRKSSVRIVVTARAKDKTGVEMEALVGASAAALTIYDMLKAVDRGMHITTTLDEKHGGRSGSYVRARASKSQKRHTSKK